MSSTTTGIEWRDVTWNPMTGCTKISAEVLVNGLSSPGLSLNLIPMSSVRGVEVYSGAATTPTSLHTSITACGTVAIWTW